MIMTYDSEELFPLTIIWMNMQIISDAAFDCSLGTVFTYNWTIGDPAIYTKDNSTPGWCNVDPAEYYNGTMLKKEDCFCIYDGIAGELCEYPTESTCVNQCSGNGLCRNGFCAVGVVLYHNRTMFVIIST